MENYLTKEIKNMEGTTLGIGIDNEKIKSAIKNNDKITTCYLLEENPSKLNKKKMKLFEKSRTVNIKKIRKTFKKKRINNLICNYKTIKPFLKTFVRDSVYINKNNIYIYGTNEDYNELTKKYKRYTNNIKIEKQKESFVIIIDSTDIQNKKSQDIKYWWIDTFANIADTLTAILVN